MNNVVALPWNVTIEIFQTPKKSQQIILWSERTIAMIFSSFLPLPQNRQGTNQKESEREKRQINYIMVCDYIPRNAPAIMSDS